jgi:hypothetical protein
LFFRNKAAKKLDLDTPTDQIKQQGAQWPV